MSKTFNGFASDRELTVKGYDDSSQVDLLVRRSPTGFGVTGIAIAPSDAPALMLAIGECLPPIPDTVRDGSYEAFMAVALEYLGKAVRALETEAAEARERAELEAEALELFKASGTYGSDRLFLKLSDLDDHVQKAWLAVARRARELAKEATK